MSEGFLELGVLQWLKYRPFRERYVTAILYLNDTEPLGVPLVGASDDSATVQKPTDAVVSWDTGVHGGALRLFPPHLTEDDDMTGASCAEADVQDIVPRGGRLVLFDARRTLHEVRPNYRERVALTCWFSLPSK